MSRTSLSDVRGLPDPLQSWNWSLIIPNIPGGGNAQGLKIKCQTSQIPGFAVDPVLVALGGAEAKYMGREIFTHSLTATYTEDRTIDTRNSLRGWMEYGRDVRNNTGKFKVDYSVEAEFVLYDDTGAETRVIILDGFYPESVSDSDVDGTASNLVLVNVTFSYDSHFES